jgi:hypothetical protein
MMPGMFAAMAELVLNPLVAVDIEKFRQILYGANTELHQLPPARHYPRWTLSVRRIHGKNSAVGRTTSAPGGVVFTHGRQPWHVRRIGSVMAVVKDDDSKLPVIDWDIPVQLVNWQERVR